MKKIVTIVGARPQFIKAAAVSREILHQSEIEEIIVHTGQHFDKNMSDVFFDEMKIPKPKYNLDIHNLSHGAMTGRMLEGIEAILQIEKPEAVMVYGDTNSTLAGALAAKKIHIRLAHVEAGLRSFNMNMPEEINRILTDRISDILFCPTDKAIKNLEKEGFRDFPSKIVKSGDVMQDTAIFYSQFSKKPTFETSGDFVLATIHRAENTDDLNRLRSILDALKEIAKDYSVILPIHPRTKNIIEKNKLLAEGITVVDPVSYLEMVYLLKHSIMVMTDSGGMQKEAFFFHKPCITLRDETEWVELVDHGFNSIVGASYSVILEAFRNMLQKKYDFNIDLYGKGNASHTIVEILKNT